MYSFNKEEVLKDWEMKLVYEASYEDGKEEGELKKVKEISKRMLTEKMPLDLIVKLTGLSLSEIESLANPLLNDEKK